MLTLLKRHLKRTPTASEMNRMARDARRARYVAFHNDMADRLGRKIEWAE